MCEGFNNKNIKEGASLEFVLSWHTLLCSHIAISKAHIMILHRFCALQDRVLKGGGLGFASHHRSTAPEFNRNNRQHFSFSSCSRFVSSSLFLSYSTQVNAAKIIVGFWAPPPNGYTSHAYRHSRPTVRRSRKGPVAVRL